MSTIFRVQDGDGRGPFRLGLSRQWIDDTTGPALPPSWIEEFGLDLLKREGRMGEHYGSGCMTLHDLTLWFQPDECVRLALLGFRVVRLDGARIIARSSCQVVFGRLRPLAEAANIVAWPLVLA